MEKYDNEIKFVQDFIYYFNPVRQAQLERAIVKNFKDTDFITAHNIILKCQTERMILISKDGWVMNKGKYVQLTGDDRYMNFVRNVDHEYILPEMEKEINKQCNMKLINCLWVLIDMLPASMDFALTHKPFQLGFISAKKEFYQVLYIPLDEEIVKFEMLKALPNDLFLEAKRSIKRVVILENDKHADRVPEGIGIKYVLSLDDSTAAHYKVLEKRSDPWKLEDEK